MAAQMAVIVPAISASADTIDFRFAYGLSVMVVLTLGAALWLAWRRSHRREQVEALHRISVRAKPQAMVAPRLQMVSGNGKGMPVGPIANRANGNAEPSLPAETLPPDRS